MTRCTSIRPLPCSAGVGCRPQLRANCLPPQLERSPRGRQRWRWSRRANVGSTRNNKDFLISVARLNWTFTDSHEVERDTTVDSAPCGPGSSRRLEGSLARIRHLVESDKWLEDVPLLVPGDQAPGSWASSGPLSTWVGPLSWRTVHGPATLVWSFGRPHWIIGGYIEGHGRVTLSKAAYPSWRVDAYAPNRYPWASVEIGPDDIKGVEVDPAVEFGNPDEEKFIALLMSDLSLVLDIQDNFAFAISFADYLMNNNALGAEIEFSGKRFSFSMRTIGWIVARIRKKGHDYLDFYARGPDDYIFDENESVPTQEELKFRLESLGITITEGANIEDDTVLSAYTTWRPVNS